MNRKIVIFAVMLPFSMVPVFSQTFGSVDNATQDTATAVDEDRGFTAQVEVTSNMFQMTKVDFSDADQRVKDRNNYFLTDNFPGGATQVLEGTNVGFGYNGGWFGGNLTVNKDGIGGINGWVRFLDGSLLVKAGNDIGYSFADSQGADAGLRVYDDSVRYEGTGQNPTVDSSKNPDNITGNEGILVQYDFAPFVFALAAGGNLSDLAKNIWNMATTDTSNPYKQEVVYGHSMSYGANIGYKVNDIARVNGAYIFQSVKNANGYSFDNPTQQLVADVPDSHVMTHQFGLYGSIYPFGDDTFGITLGYAGVLLDYLDEFGVMDKTTMPQVFKSGINLTAQYKTGNLTLKTDHNFSFWTDKNYSIFNLHRPHPLFRDYGLDPQTVGAAMADVSHNFLWNGIGAIYRFTDVLEGKVYARNLLRMDQTEQYGMTDTYSQLELRSTFYIGSSVEAYVAMLFGFTGRSVSESLNNTVGIEFAPGFAPKSTMDTKMSLQIPIGLKVKLQPGNRNN